MARNLSLLLALCLCGLASGCQPLTKFDNDDHLSKVTQQPSTSTAAPMTTTTAASTTTTEEMTTTTEMSTTTTEATTTEKVWTDLPIQVTLNVKDCPYTTVSDNAKVKVSFLRTDRSFNAYRHTKSFELSQSGSGSNVKFESGPQTIDANSCKDNESVCEKFDKIVVEFPSDETNKLYISSIDVRYGSNNVTFGPFYENAKCTDVVGRFKWLGVVNHDCNGRYYGTDPGFYVYSNAGVASYSKAEFSKYLSKASSITAPPCHIAASVQRVDNLIAPQDSSCNALAAADAASLPGKLFYSLIHYNRNDLSKPPSSSQGTDFAAWNKASAVKRAVFNMDDETSAIRNPNAILLKYEGGTPVWLGDIKVKVNDITGPPTFTFKSDPSCVKENKNFMLGKFGQTCDNYFGTETTFYFLYTLKAGIISAMKQGDVDKFMSGNLDPLPPPCS